MYKIGRKVKLQVTILGIEPMKRPAPPSPVGSLGSFGVEGDDERFGMLADDFDLASQQPSEDPVLSNDFGNSDDAMPKDSIPVTLALEKSWDFLDGKQISLPWEDGVWKTIFSDKPSLSLQPIFERPDAEHVQQEAAPPSASSMGSGAAGRNNVGDHWTFAISNTDVQTWQEQHEARKETALKRWFDVLDGVQRGYPVIVQFQGLKDTASKLRMLGDIFSTRAPLTLLKRVNSLLRYCTFLENQGSKFPGSEVELYTFACVQRDQNAPRSRLQSLIESIRFCQYVVGFDGLSDDLLSRRVVGAAAKLDIEPKSQASPLTVRELRCLHAELELVDGEFWDKVAAGAILFAVYSRARWTDLQHAEEVFVDEVDDSPYYLEARVLHHKTRRSNTWGGSAMPLVVPAVGVVDTNWVKLWWDYRCKLLDGLVMDYPPLPAPDQEGNPTGRPVSTSEVGKWMNILLTRHGCPAGDRRRSSHSMKATMLSYLSKAGASISDRELLGGHSSHVRSVITYSRDALGGPMRVLEELLYNIRSDRFRPDESRSGRFVQKIKTEKLPESQRELDVLSVDSSSSDESSGDTSSSSDEEASESANCGRMVKAPANPHGTKLVQHQKSNCVHLVSEGCSHSLLCGITISHNFSFEVPNLMRWDTPLCGRCWKRSSQRNL